ncbi:uncharacterized protein [Primulina huaijiensis]|uniref:uncharacterized protein n=1 Tax=Primulina huaijiensis TaxID=1492673 RepID=UPI003CC6FA7B
MAAKPISSETIALAEKKMDMTLDDIIKMSKTNDAKPKKQRVSNRNQKFANNATQDKSARLRKFMDTRSSLRQGALARRRSNFQGNQFPLATEAARKAAAVPLHNRGFNRNRTFNVNKPRVGAPPVKNVSNGGGFTVNKPAHQANVVAKQRTQTLDSLFANMKEQRMKVLSKQNNGRRRNGGGQHAVPWVRGRLHY